MATQQLLFRIKVVGDMKATLFALWKHVLLPNVTRSNSNIQRLKIQESSMKSTSFSWLKSNRLQPEHVSLSLCWPFDIRKMSKEFSSLWWTHKRASNLTESPRIQSTPVPWLDVEVGSVLKKRKKKMNKHKLKRRRKRDRMKTK